MSSTPLLDRWSALEAGTKSESVVALQKRLVDHDLGRWMGRSPTDGEFGPGTQKALARFQSHNGLPATGVVDKGTHAVLMPRQSPVFGDFQGVTAPPKATIEAGRKTEVGQKLSGGLDANLDTYLEASKLTGVPVELLAIIHGNESTFGTNASATKGKEAGWGLDPKWVSTKWGQSQLAQVERLNGREPGSLGSWKRKANTPGANLRSAVVAAEHLKRNAALAKVPIHAKMTQADIAGVLGSWRAGPTAGKKAREDGKHHLFDPSVTDTPHAYHPGGSSVGSGGRRRVRSGVKKGSLRGDVMLPLLQKEFAKRKVKPSG